jgi:hypothetical protein
MRDDIDIQLVALEFLECQRFSRGSSGMELVQSLHAAGAVHPSLELDANWNLLAWYETEHGCNLIRHPCFGEDSGSVYDVRNGWQESRDAGSAECALYRGGRSLLVSRGASFHVQGDAGVDRTFSGLLQFGTSLYPQLCPQYGSLDDFGEPDITEEDVKRLHLNRICWANFFGPAYVNRLGRSFLHDAPAWKVEDLPDGGVLILATESFMAWRYDPYFGERWPYGWDRRCEHPLAQHFQRFYPDLVIFRGEADLT